MKTFPAAARRYEVFCREVFGEGAVGRVRELPLPDPSAPVPELEVQARWFAGEFGRQFVSPDGESVEIVQFGHWNRSAGPDFTEVAVRIDGELHRGAVEVDLEVTSWEAHGHGANPAFDEVVLHVFVGHFQAEAPRFHTRDSRHRRIVQIALDPTKVMTASRPWGQLPEAKRGRCATPLSEMSDSAIESLLHAAAQYRLHRKARRFVAIAEAHTENQALYQAVAEALGYRHNKLVMAVLSQRLPLAELRKLEPAEREALLFGVAGFLDHEHFRDAADSTARDYLKALWDYWWKHRDAHEPEPDRKLTWKLAGTRPTNHPQRRVAALAALVNDWTKFRQLVTAADAGGNSKSRWTRSLQDHLGGLTHDYWQHHYTLKAKPTGKPLALIGKDRIRDLLGNVLFPAAIASQPHLWEAYLDLPGAVVNESLRRARLRLFGSDEAVGERWSRRYWQQQALLQIYADFCLEDASECAECPFPEQLRQWQGEVDA